MFLKNGGPKMRFILFFFLTFFCFGESLSYPEIPPQESIKSKEFVGEIWHPMPESVIQRISGKSYKEQAPVSLNDLAYLQLNYYDFSGNIQKGELVVHHLIAKEILDIFQDIFAIQYPIELMQLVDDFDADDDLSMEHNNSSCFNFRENVTKPGVFSNHAYGLAVDINPKLNPYVRGDLVLPSNAIENVPNAQRESYFSALIHDKTLIYEIFAKRGWEWGGHLEGRKDYHHFAKYISEINAP